MLNRLTVQRSLSALNLVLFVSSGLHSSAILALHCKPHVQTISHLCKIAFICVGLRLSFTVDVNSTLLFSAAHQPQLSPFNGSHTWGLIKLVLQNTPQIMYLILYAYILQTCMQTLCNEYPICWTLASLLPEKQ